ncbi:MAG: CinA family protein [Sulfurimonas sp.]|nr:CinA family protein [Sulfurimonas sp.]
MKLHLIFIGNQFVYNRSLKEYVLRRIENESLFISFTTYFKSNDNSLFLYLEERLNSCDKIIIITSKKNFSTIGKLICTVTSDNQVLNADMLIPQKASLFEPRSYLLEYNNTIVNVMQIDEGELMPQVLMPSNETQATVYVVEEKEDMLVTVLTPIAQMYEVSFSVTQEVEGFSRIDISSKRYGEISKFIYGAKKLLPKKLIVSANIITYIIEKLSSVGKKVSFAESCTGGLLAYYFTQENGASKILDGSLVTYSNDLKENWLAVSNQTLRAYGAVSANVVEEMSEGVMNVSSADYTISISGIAGDGGGSIEKPVGTVYIGVRSKSEHLQVHLLLHGDRNYIQHQSALYAIKMLLLIDKETFF